MQPRETRPPLARSGFLAHARTELWVPLLISSPHSFLGRGPPGHATGLSTSLRHLSEVRECEAVPSPPGEKTFTPAQCQSYVLPLAWCKAEAEKRVTDGRKGGRDTHMVFPCHWLTLCHFLDHSLALFLHHLLQAPSLQSPWWTQESPPWGPPTHLQRVLLSPRPLWSSPGD